MGMPGMQGMKFEGADPQQAMKQGQGAQNPMGGYPGQVFGSYPNSGNETPSEGANGKNQQQQMSQMPGTNPNMMGMGMMGQMQVNFSN
jgi:hypothetical protein